MSRKIFVSYNFADKQIAHQIPEFFQPQGGKCQGEAVFVTNDVSSQGDAAIDREIRTVMAPCIAVLFVVGENSHNSPWIDREAEIAISRGLAITAVRNPGTSGGLPNRIVEKIKDQTRIVEWGQNTLCEVLNGIPQPNTTS